MIHDIRHAFNDLLHENMWMDKETRLVAEDKANNMRERIGYPEYITNTTRLIDEYKNVSLDIKIGYTDLYLKSLDVMNMCQNHWTPTIIYTPYLNVVKFAEKCGYLFWEFTSPYAVHFVFYVDIALILTTNIA